MSFNNKLLGITGVPVRTAALLACMLAAPGTRTGTDGAAHKPMEAHDHVAKVARVSAFFTPVSPHAPIDGPARLAAPPPREAPADWLATVKRSIMASEYHIRFQEHVGALQSPNRAQGLRITYHADGFSLTPRVNSDAWRTDLRVASIGHDTQRFVPAAMPAITVQDSAATLDHGPFALHYTNDERGMRQDFLVRERPTGDGPLEVRLHYEGTLHATAQGKGDILFSLRDTATGAFTPCVWYRDLRAWDADGDTLDALAFVEDGTIVLAVDDAQARYPITIDPLSTTANWNKDGGQANAHFGQAVRTAGDVNGDGYSDVIVGAPEYDGGLVDQGAAYVYLGSAIGLSTTPIWSRTDGTAGAAFGMSVSTAGDVNGDGYSDVIVGAPYDNTGGNTRAGRAFLYTGGPGGVNTTPRTMGTGVANDLFGWSVACAGDVQGDGYSDVLIGAPGYTAGANGKAYLFHGGTGTFNTVNDWNVTGSAENLGFSVSSAGDVNGDGLSDILMGSPGYSGGGLANQGRAIAFRGTSNTGTYPGGIVPGVWWHTEGGQAGASLGRSVSWAGDVDGDDYGDIIVGAPGYTNGQAGEGAAMYFEGSAGGLAATPQRILESNSATANFGWCVSGAGDVNGDGYADVIVGAPGYDNGIYFNAGAAYVYEGQGGSGVFGGLPATASWMVTPGGQQGIEYGTSVSTAGDVNGDGFSDVLVGAPKRTNGQTNEGRAYVYHGSARGMASLLSSTIAFEGTQAGGRLGFSVSTLGMRPDGYTSAIIGAPLYDNGQVDEGRAIVVTSPTNVVSWSAESDQTGAQFGFSVSTAGDVNNDGLCDVIIGAPYYDNGQVDEGRVFIYHGINSPAELAATPAATRESDQANAHFGWSVSTAGDVNGDGYSDVIVGAPDYDNGQVDEGRAYVYHGGSGGIGATAAWTTESDQAGARLGACVAGGGDVNGDGYDDVIVGAPLYDGAFTDEGQARIHAGSPTGPQAAPHWTTTAGKANSSLGASVAMAGDVDGNGRTDVIVGAPGFDNVQADVGRAYVFLSGDSGPVTTPAWTMTDGVANANLGYSVSKAGDVNGDGYGDIVVGAPGEGNGRVRVYHGSPTGPSATPDFDQTGTQAGERYGTSVSNAGSMLGSGYGDVLVGAPMHDQIFAPNSPDVGGVDLYYGNFPVTSNGSAPKREPIKQYRPFINAVVQPGNGTFSGSCGWTIGQEARSYLGRRGMTLVWEITGHGPPFATAGGRVGNSTAYTGQYAIWTNVLGGSEIKVNVTTSTSAFPKWRVRVRYHPATMIDGQPFGRWLYFGINDRQEPAIKTTTPDCGLLPVELTAFDARCDGDAQTLAWTTASEHNSSHFTVQRSMDGSAWADIGRVDAAGNSQYLTAYTFTDPAPPAGQVLYYRLRQVDLDGSAKEYDAVAAFPCAADGMALIAFPNPAEDGAYIQLSGEMGIGRTLLHMLDGQGRIIRTTPLPEDGRTHFDLRDLAPGVYTVAIAGPSAQAVRPVRIIKQ